MFSYHTHNIHKHQTMNNVRTTYIHHNQYGLRDHLTPKPEYKVADREEATGQVEVLHYLVLKMSTEHNTNNVPSF